VLAVEVNLLVLPTDILTVDVVVFVGR